MESHKGMVSGAGPVLAWRLKSLANLSLSSSRLSCTLRWVARPRSSSYFSRVSSSMCSWSALKRLRNRT